MPRVEAPCDLAMETLTMRMPEPPSVSADVAMQTFDDRIKCTDTIEAFAETGVHNFRHYFTFDGVVERAVLVRDTKMDYGLLAVKTNTKDEMTGANVWGRFQSQMFRNTLCNNIDTMNNKLLRDGKPRIHVQSIDSSGKDSDPDAGLTFFFESAKDYRIVFLGNISTLEGNAEAQRCMRKAKEHEIRVLEDSLKKNDARHAFAYKDLSAKKDTEITKLQAKIAELEASAAATEADKVGAKRARTDSEAGMESAVVLQLVNGITEKDKQLTETRKQLDIARLKSDELEAMLGLKDNQLFMTIIEKDRQIAELNNERKDKDKKLSELNQQYIELGKEKDKQLLDKDKQLNRARAEGGAKYDETKKKWDKTIGFLRKASTTCAALLTAFASGDKNKLRSEMRKTRDLLNKIVSEHAAFAWSKALVVPELPQRRRNNDAEE